MENNYINEVDKILTEKEQSFKKKIFSLSKMESLVFSDPKLTSVYNEMAENGEEKYGYHYNETIMNIIFNEYVLNSSKYLQKYKMAIPKKKKRRDKTGINQLKKEVSKKSTTPETPETQVSLDEEENPVQIVFLIKKDDSGDEEVFGYLPDEQVGKVYDRYRKGISANGEEAMIDPNMASECKIASPDEYNSLKEALNEKGYNFEVLNEKLNETTSAGSAAGGGSSYVGYAGPAVWGSGDLMKTKGSSKKDKKSFWDGGSMVKESTENYLIDTQSFEDFFNFLNEDVRIDENKIYEQFMSEQNHTREDDINYIQKNSEEYGSLAHMSDDDLHLIANDIKTQQLDEKSKSVAQQQLFGMVDALQKGELKPDEVSPQVRKMAKNISHKDVKDFASTKHNDLPQKISETNMNNNEWIGIDADLEISLFEYGVVAKQPNDRNYQDEWFVLYQLNENQYDTGWIREAELNNLILGKEWADEQSINSFLSTLGVSKDNWLKEPFINKIQDLLQYYGYENIMGSSYNTMSKEEALEMIEENNNNDMDEDSQTMIGDMNDTMATSKPVSTGDNGIETGTRDDMGGGLNENFDDLNNELKIFEMQMKKLKKMNEDRKPGAIVLRDRMGSENEKNFKSDFKKSDTQEIVNAEDALEWKSQQEDVGDPHKLADDIEKKAIDATKGVAFENKGNSTNEKGDEIPKRNYTTEEADEVSLYRKGLGDYVYANKPDKRFEERMKRDMGEENYEMRQKRMAFNSDAPMYNKDTQPVEDGVEKAQFDAATTKWNERFGIKEAVVTGKYFDSLNKTKYIDFNLADVKEVKSINENAFYLLNLKGLGNSYDNKVDVNESVNKAINSFKFYTDGKIVFGLSKSKSLNENEKKEVKVVNENVTKMKHLFNYSPNSYVDSKKTTI